MVPVPMSSHQELKVAPGQKRMKALGAAMSTIVN